MCFTPTFKFRQWTLFRVENVLSTCVSFRRETVSSLFDAFSGFLGSDLGRNEKQPENWKKPIAQDIWVLKRFFRIFQKLKM